jgi:tetratricopeptide (TPR) repeat protein
MQPSLPLPSLVKMLENDPISLPPAPPAMQAPDECLLQEANALLSTGKSYKKRKEYYNAATNFKNALKCYEKAHADDACIEKTCLKIVNIYEKIYDLNRDPDNLYRLMQAYSEISRTFDNHGKFEQAFLYSMEALKACDNYDATNVGRIDIFLQKVIVACFKTNRPERAIPYCERAVKHFESEPKLSSKITKILEGLHNQIAAKLSSGGVPEDKEAPKPTGWTTMKLFQSFKPKADSAPPAVTFHTKNTTELVENSVFQPQPTASATSKEKLPAPRRRSQSP